LGSFQGGAMLREFLSGNAIIVYVRPDLVNHRRMQQFSKQPRSFAHIATSMHTSGDAL
jgi:hypothetical protein